MVERPIKKSERQQAAASTGEGTVESSRPARGEGDAGSNRSSFRGKGKGRGKGPRDEDRPTAPANPALMRGPKPAKPQPVVEAAPEVEAAADETETTETTETSES